MTIERAKLILRFLAEGADPLTGEVLPEDSVCNKAEIVRAFYCILNELETEKSAPNRKLPENAGRPWTKEEDKKLLKMFDEGRSNKEMMSALGRTKGSIISRLARLGKVDNPYMKDPRR